MMSNYPIGAKDDPRAPYNGEIHFPEYYVEGTFSGYLRGDKEQIKEDIEDSLKQFDSDMNIDINIEEYEREEYD